jgi:DTW domain-containing protein YfiP
MQARDEAAATGGKIANRIAVLILQHPQEKDAELGSAGLVTATLANATLRTGLSWPSLAKALGRPAEPRDWAILHLGATRGRDLPEGREIVALDKKGVPLDDQAGALAGIAGIIALDGSWSQAKTLWWRNAWVLKCRRLALNPRRPSLYGRLRREPRRESLSTSEAVGLALAGLEGKPEIERELTLRFGARLDQYRTQHPAA